MSTGQVPEQKPSVGRIVHYIGESGAGSGCRAGLVYRLGMQAGGVYLVIFDSGGIHTLWSETFYNDAHAPDSWHYPERV